MTMHAASESSDAARSPGRRRARGWFRDPAVWAWGIAGLLALLPLRLAFAVAPANPAQDPHEAAVILPIKSVIPRR